MAPPATRGMGAFLTMWLGQALALLGCGLTSFALVTRLYRPAGATTQLTMLTFFAIVPSIALSPLAGALVDRWDRRAIMIWSDLAAALSTLALVLLLALGKVELWHIYLAAAARSLCDAFRWPAFSALTSELVPRRHIGRASGMLQAAQAGQYLLSPVLAGALVGSIEVPGVMLLDCALSGLAVLTMLLVRPAGPAGPFWKTAHLGAVAPARRRQGLSGAGDGWSFIRSRPGLLGLLLFFACSNYIFGVVEVLLAPLVLGFAPPVMLGTVMAAGGGGMLLGSAVISVWGGPTRRVPALLALTALEGLCLVLGGLRPSVALIAAATFGYLGIGPLAAGIGRSIWQSKVPAALQGRVFAVRTVVAFSSLPLAFLSAGWLTDALFAPLLQHGGALARSIGAVLGVGPGRGIGLLLIVLGLASALLALAGSLSPRLRRLEEEVADAAFDQESNDAEKGDDHGQSQAARVHAEHRGDRHHQERPA